MEFFAGVFRLSWWECALVALGLTHITIASVTIFLHRHQAHRALDLHPVVSHFFRFWLWLTTGMRTVEWVAIHRKHHARCETVDDPHSPQILGINTVLWLGVFLYAKESHIGETLERYGHQTPDDWVERSVYSRHPIYGPFLMGAIDIALFGLVPGLFVLVVQIVWIPFWAAGVINGVGHYWGYRHWSTPDASTNIVPWGVFIGGEELHNNHHAYPSSAKLSCQWYEVDVGWMYIRILEVLGLATVKKLAPKVGHDPVRTVLDERTLEAVLGAKYHVLARFDALVKKLKEEDRQTALELRANLVELWARSLARKEDLLAQLRAWCNAARRSRVPELEGFAYQLTGMRLKK